MDADWARAVTAIACCELSVGRKYAVSAFGVCKLYVELQNRAAVRSKRSIEVRFSPSRQVMRFLVLSLALTLVAGVT